MSNFEADAEIQKIAEAYALDMIDYAKQTHGIDLDWSDDSVQPVERIAALLHDDYGKTRPSSEQVAPFYKALGSYVGEVFRRNHGAEWGWVTLQGNRFPGMQHKPGSLFWPWGKATESSMDQKTTFGIITKFCSGSRALLAANAHVSLRSSLIGPTALSSRFY